MSEQQQAGTGSLFASSDSAAPSGELTDMAYRAGRFDRRKAIIDGKPISKRQSAYYCFIHRYINEHDGTPPSLREIGAAMGVSAVAACKVIQTLERNGWLRVARWKARGIALAPPSDPADRAEPEAVL